MSLDSHSGRFSAPKADSEGKVSLIGMEMPQLQELLVEEGLPKFRAKQLWNWIYHRGVKEFSSMENLPKDMRATLEEKYTIARPKLVTEQRSGDGTIKWLLEMSDGQQVETVYIPEERRGTLCISSQVGCTLTCTFCHTGTQGLVRNLGANEIVQQILYTRDILEEWPETGEKVIRNNRELTNIVMMGMGEPLYNYDNVATALKICMDDNGLNVSKRRITLSTSGIIPQIEQCGRELEVNLAISLHAPNDELRSKLMPINKKYPIAELLRACREYPGVSENRRITFEYIMIKDLNDTDSHAFELANILKGIPSKINLIPFNVWEGSDYETSSRGRVSSFANILERAGYEAPIRKPRGRDISAACGQLKSDSIRAKRLRDDH